MGRGGGKKRGGGEIPLVAVADCKGGKKNHNRKNETRKEGNEKGNSETEIITNDGMIF